MINQRNSKDFLKSQAVSKRRKKRFFFRLYLFIFMMIIILSGTVYLLRLDKFQIKKVVVTGNVTLSETEIEEYINTLIDSKYFFIIPKTSTFLYPKDKITEKTKNKFLRIHNLDMDIEAFTYLNVKVKERQAVAKWCNPVECFFIDDTGYVFSKEFTGSGEVDGKSTFIVSTSSPESDILIITGMDEVIGSDPFGKNIIDAKRLSSMIDISVQIESMGMKIREVEYRSYDEIIFKIFGSGRIIFNERRTFDESINNLKTAIKSDVFKNKLSDFEYIDTRFGNKVFYKFKNQAPVEDEE
jgi:hypothetical protein